MGKNCKKAMQKLCTLFLIISIFALGLGFGPPPSYADSITGTISNATINGLNYVVQNLEGSILTYPSLQSLSFTFGASFNLSDTFDKYRASLKISDSSGASSTFIQNLNDNTVTFAPYQFPAASKLYNVTIELLDGTNNNTLITSVSFSMDIGRVDTTAPQVAERSPENGAYNVPVNAAIQFKFNEEVDGQSVNEAGNITLRYDNTNHNFTASLASDKKTVTLTPMGNLVYNKLYTVSLKAGGIKDLAGNGVAAASWSFTTAADPGANPVIETRDPASGATGVAVTKNIVINLSKELDLLTVTGDAITLKKGSTTIPVTLIPQNVYGKGRITIDPIADLENNVVYTVNIAGNKIKDVDGKYLAGTSWSFTTELGALPIIVERYPAVNENNIPVDVQISIRFSKSMNPSTINNSNIYLRKSGSTSNIPAAVSYSSSSKTAYLKPNSELQLDTDYYVYVTNGVKDVDGYAVSAVNWKFTTDYRDSVRIQDRSPAADATNVPVDANITFKFSAPMYASSINDNNIYIRRSGYSTNISASVSYNSSSRTVTITPDSNLRYDTEYIVYVTSNVKDSDRISISPASWKFRTMPEDYLRIIERDPAPGAENVAVNKQITMKFSKAMRSTTITNGNIYLRKSGTSTNVPATVSYDSSTRIATLSPDSVLAGNTEYTVYVTANVKDADLNPISATNWSFKTKADPVKIIFLDPGYDETGVSVDKTIFLAFSKAMSSSSINSSNIYIKKYGTSTVIPASVSYNSSSYTVAIDPIVALEYNTKYTVYLTSSVKDADGVSITPVSWSFVTADEPASKGTEERPLVKINGKYVNFTDAFPYLKNGRTMIPFRALFEAINAEIGFDKSNAKQPKVTGKLGSNTVTLYVGSLTAYRNNTAIKLDVPAEIVNGRTMIPLRFAGEALGATVNWDKNTFTVIIETK